MEGNNTINDSVMSNVEKALFASADLVSSGDSGLESAIQNSIQAVKQGQEASAGRINRTFNDLEQSAIKTGVSSTVNANESRRGFATQTAVLRNILDTTNEELKGLRTQREELLLAGEAEAASQISGLMVKQAEARQQAMQQSFSNMLQLGQYEQGNQQLQLQRDQFKQQVKRDIFDQDQAKLQNGIQMLELAYNRADNEFQRGIAMEQLNIQKSELALSQARLAIAQSEANKSTIQPSAGFGDLESEGVIRGIVADGLANINNQLDSGKMSEEDAIAAKMQLFNDVRTRTPEGVATTEALLGTIGLPVAESAEASKDLAMADLAEIQAQAEADRQAVKNARNIKRKTTVPSNVPFMGGIYMPDMAGQQLPIY